MRGFTITWKLVRNELTKYLIDWSQSGVQESVGCISSKEIWKPVITWVDQTCGFQQKLKNWIDLDINEVLLDQTDLGDKTFHKKERAGSMNEKLNQDYLKIADLQKNL